MTEPFRNHSKLARSLHIINKILTGIIFVGYILLLLWLFIRHSAGLVKAILVPLVGLVAVSVFRVIINRPRPYEKFQTEAIIPKKTKGKSFPSRHVFSAAVITGTFFAQGLWICGSICLVMTFILALIRVLSGVHYISDVLAAMLVAAAMCLLYEMHLL